MSAEKDFSLQEVGRLTLTLRQDLVFTPHHSGDETYYVIEDPLNSRFHRLGLAEYTFVSLLDGATPVAQAVETAASIAPQYALSEQDAAKVCQWLVDTDLAFTESSRQTSRLVDRADQAARRARRGRWNPITTRLPLVCPDRHLARPMRWFRWIHSPAAVAVWSVVVVLAAYFVCRDWDRVAAASQGVLAPGNWFWLALSWLCLKVVHEFSHATACKRYDGSVRDAGVLLILFAPLPYVDVTSSWQFRSKWQRIQTAAAGVYIELFIAALATFVWVATEPGPLNHVCYNVMLMASLVTLLVNANPLMRFDGYYVLSDLLEIPNLYSGGQQCLQAWARRWFLGVAAQPPAWSRSHHRLMMVYGVAALWWRVLVCAGLVIAASTLLRGAGVVLACLAVALWVGTPLVHLCRQLAGQGKHQRPNLLRFGVTAGGGTLLLTLLLTVVPWPGSDGAPAVVEYDPLALVRAKSDGFVREVHVQSGDSVEAGQLLLVLENDALMLKLAELRNAIQVSDVRARVYRNTQQMAAFQAELQNRMALLKRQAEMEAQVAAMVVRAEQSGKVLGRNLERLMDTYVEEGTELMAIGDEDRKALTVSVGEQELDAYAGWVGRQVSVRVGTAEAFSSRLVRLDPQAERAPPHPALSAALGGPLAVVPADKGAPTDEAAPQYQLVAPRFEGQVALEPSTSRRLRSGQLASVSIWPWRESIGSRLYRTASGWIREKLHAHRGA